MSTLKDKLQNKLQPLLDFKLKSRSRSRSPNPELLPTSAESQSTANLDDEDPSHLDPHSSTTSRAPVEYLVPSTTQGPATEPSENSELLTIDEAKERNSGSRFQKVVDVGNSVATLAKVVGPFLNSVPFAKAALDAFIQVAGFLNSVEDINKKAASTLGGIARLSETIQNNLSETSNVASHTKIETFARFLIDEASNIHQQYSSGLSKKLLRSDKFKDEVDAIIGWFEGVTRRFLMDVSLATERDTKAILTKLIANDEAKWLRAPTAIYNNDVSAGAPKRYTCTEGTREDILERITRWASDASSPPIFWLSGMAGRGKSTIAATICHRLDEENLRQEHDLHASLGASFFCSRQVPDLCRLANIIPTIVYQLARHSRTFGQALAGANHDAVHASKKQVRELLVTPWLLSMKSRLVELPLTVVVIDALDEIEDDGGKRLLEDLINAVSATGGGLAGLKILVTSRPHPRIVEASRDLPSESIYRLEDISAWDERADIKKYLDAELALLPDSERDRLALLADGLFIYAATIVRYISPPDITLSVKQQSERLSRLKRLDTTLPSASSANIIESLYSYVVREAIPEDQELDDLLILFSVICAFRAVSADELAELIAPGEGEADAEAVRLLVSRLHAVMYFKEGRIYIYHKSFSDFILSDGRGSLKLAYSSDATRLCLAGGCVQVMNTHLRFNICNLPSSFLDDSDVPGLQQTIEENILRVPGLEYACRYWASHLMQVPATGEHLPSLFKLLLEFGLGRTLFWIEVMNLLGAGMDCYAAVNGVIDWLNSEMVAELKTVFTAVSRLTRSFVHTPSSISTPHLYISSLATELSTNTDIPREWKQMFPRVPHVRCNGVSNHGGTLMAIYTESSVRSVAFSTDSMRVVSGSLDKWVRIWDTSTGKEVQRLDGHTGFVNSVVFSHDGTRVVSGSWDKSVRIWDTSAGREVQRLDGHTGYVRSVAFSHDGTHIVSGSEDKSVRIWDTSTGKEVQRLAGHTRYVRSVAFSHDGTRVVSGSDDQSVRIWDTSTGKEVQKLDGHTGYVLSAVFSYDGTRIVSGSSDKSVRIWDTFTGTELYRLDGHTSGISSVAFSHDSTRIVSGSSDNSVRIWDTFTGKELQRLDGHTGYVNSVAFSHDGTRVVSGSYDNSVRIWDMFTENEVQRLNGHTGDVNSVAFSHDGTRVVSGSHDESVRIWGTSTGKEVQRLEGHTGYVRSVAFSHDGARVVSGSEDKSVRIWDTSTGREVQRLDGHTGYVRSVTFSHDGTRIVLGSSSESVQIWDTSTGKEVQRLDGHTGYVRSVAFSHDDTRVVSGSEDKSVRIWDTSTGEEVQRLVGHTGYVRSVAFSHDGTHVVSGSDDDSVRIWDMSTGKEVQRLDGHTRYVLSVAFSHDGTRVVSGSGDKSVRIWDTSTGTQVQRLAGHTGSVSSVAFSYDSTHIVSGSSDSSLRIWDTPTRPGSNEMEWTFSPDGWVKDKSSQARLLWLPLHFETGLLTKHCLRVISRAGSTSLQFSRDSLGTNWAHCYSSNKRVSSP